MIRSSSFFNAFSQVDMIRVRRGDVFCECAPEWLVIIYTGLVVGPSSLDVREVGTANGEPCPGLGRQALCGQEVLLHSFSAQYTPYCVLHAAYGKTAGEGGAVEEEAMLGAPRGRRHDDRLFFAAFDQTTS